MYSGTIRFLNNVGFTNGTKFVFSYEKEKDFTRLDVYREIDLDKMNPMNTSACVCSIIKDYIDEYKLGNEDFIKFMLDTLNYSYTDRTDKNEDDMIVSTFTDGTKAVRTEYYDVKKSRLSKIQIIVSDVVNISATYNVFNTTNRVKPVNITQYSSKKQSIKLLDNNDEYCHSYEYIKAINPDIEILDKRDYVVVQNMDDFYSRFDEIIHTTNQYVGVDTETSGLGVTFMGKDYLVGVILSDQENKSTYYPFRHDISVSDSANPFDIKWNIPEKYIDMMLNGINNIRKDTIVLAHNKKMELASFYKETKKVLRVDIDTMIYSIVCRPRFSSDTPHDLKSLAEEFDKVRYLDLIDVFKNRKKIDFSKLRDIRVIRDYACPDGDNTIKVLKGLQPELPPDSNFIVNLDSNGQEIKALQNEYYGLKVNLEKLTEYRDRVKGRCDFLKELFQLSVNDRRSITSPIALRDIIYRKLGAPVLAITAKDKLPACNKTALKLILKDGAIKEENKSLKPIVYNGEELVKAKELNNKYYPLAILSAYRKNYKDLTGLERMLKLQVGSRIPFYVKEIGAESSRQASDAQQYDTPKKATIESDSPYHDEYSIDYKQIEYRVMALLAGEDVILEWCNDPDADLHRIMRASVIHKEVWDISAAERQKAKSSNFGIIYRMSGYGLASYVFGPNPTDEQVAIADSWILEFKQTFTKINRKMVEDEREIRTTGGISTKFGWHRYDKRILDEETPERIKRAIVRALGNTPIQGFAATLLKLAEARMYAKIKEKGWDKLVDCGGIELPMVRMMLPIHDEILVSAHRSIPTEELLEVFRFAFEMDIPMNTSKYKCSFFAAPALVNNWADGKNDAYEIPIKYRDKLIDDWKRTGQSVINKENWLPKLQEYRNNEVKDWVMDMLKSSKNFTELVEKVRHPILTHTLISLCASKDEQNSLEHRDVIALSIYKYITGKGVKDKDIKIDYNIDIHKAVIEELRYDAESDLNEVDEEYINDYQSSEEDTNATDEFNYSEISQNNSEIDDEDREEVIILNKKSKSSKETTTQGTTNNLRLFTANECIYYLTDNIKESKEKIVNICNSETENVNNAYKVYVIVNDVPEYIGISDRSKLIEV